MFLELAEESDGSRRGTSAISEITYLFQPDTILPFQYSDLLRRKTYLEGEKKLMLAVLEDAVNCFQKYYAARDKKGKELFREAEEWIVDENNDRLFSFSDICESLGINPEYLRWGLVQWKQRQICRQQPAGRKEMEQDDERSGLRHGSR